MQVVGDLVRLDPDGRALDPVDRPVELLQLHAPERLGEGRPEPRVEESPERQAAPDQVLPEARLRLVQPHRRCRGQRRAVVLGGEALLVEPVAELVHRAEHRGRRVAGVDPRGEPHVGGVGSSGERMDAPVLPAGVQVEAEELQQLEGELPLLLRVEGPPVEHRGSLDRAVERLHQGNERCAQPLQHREQPCGGHLRLEVVEQGVVALSPVAHGVGLLAAQLEEALRARGRTGSKPALGPRLPPALEAGGLGLGEGPHQRLGDPHRMVALAPEHLEHRPGVGVEVAALGLLEPLAHLGRHQPLVVQPLERGELRGARRAGLRRGGTSPGPRRAGRGCRPGP